MVVALLTAAALAIVFWVLNARPVDHWLGVYTGTTDEMGPYYGFWSGFGADLSEFAIVGVIGTAIYQLVKRYNCHEPGCWHVGTHPAAGGQFLLCYRHHPDFEGQKPTHELIERIHREHGEREAAFHSKLAATKQHASTDDTNALR
jgi:hypothetical protein